MWDWTGSGSALGPKWTRWSPPPFVWQAWHLVTSTVTLAWQAWHLWDWTGSGVRPHNLSRLVHTTCPHTTCRHTCVAHANPSPSLFSFPHFPSHLYLSFASYWKQLTCGVIRSFIFFLKPGWMDACLLPLNMSGIKKSRKAKAETMYVPHSARSISQPPAC